MSTYSCKHKNNPYIHTTSRVDRRALARLYYLSNLLHGKVLHPAWEGEMWHTQTFRLGIEKFFYFLSKNTMIKKPWDPSYDANTKQMNEIYAKQWPDARKTDLDEATIAILEDCMNEKEVSHYKGNVDREKTNKEFKGRLAAMTDEELLAARKHEKGNSGSGMARMNRLGFMREEIERRGIK